MVDGAYFPVEEEKKFTVEMPLGFFFDLHTPNKNISCCLLSLPLFRFSLHCLCLLSSAADYVVRTKTDILAKEEE